MNDRIILWIWLQDCIGFANPKIKAIFDFFEKPEDIFMANEQYLRSTKLFNEHTILKLMDKDFRYARKIHEDCQKLGYQIISLFDDRYPKKLKEINDSPVVLYVDGTMPDTEKTLCTAIVGSRAATKESKKYAFDIGAGLAIHHTIVVSGGAEGIDTEAHKGTLSCGGKTICVLGCGINYNYLLKNGNLRKEISQNGAVISEYPPYMSSQKHTFVQRNRIIAGICDCTLIVQAGIKSGSLHTAREALKNKRMICIIKGSENDTKFEGSNSLLKDGAKSIKTHSEILDWYESTGHIIAREVTVPFEFEPKVPVAYQTEKETEFDYLSSQSNVPKKKMKDSMDKILSEQLTKNALMVYHTISDMPVDADDISNQTELDVNAITASLTELEMMGLVTQIAGRRYIRK